MGKEIKKIFNDLISPYLMVMKYSSWEFTLFFVLSIMFFSSVLDYLKIIFSNLNLNPENLINNSTFILISILLLIIFSLLAIFYYWAIKKNNNKNKILIIICFLIIQALILSINIYRRYNNTNPAWSPQDGILQTETALDYVLKGKNPYQEDYYGTAMDNETYHWIKFDSVHKQWTMLNPALESYVYMPLFFILPLPFKYIFVNIFHFYDNRIFNFLIYLLSCLLIYKLPSSLKKKNGLILFFSLNTFLYTDIIFGFGDIVPMYFLLWAYFFLKKERYAFSIIMISLAGLIKQNMIFYWPFFLAFILFKKYLPITKQSLLKFIKYPLIILSLICLVLLPFILWNPMAFYHDTVYYLGHLYPARGLGLAGLLLQLKIIADPYQFYNFAIWQIIFIITFLPLLLHRQYKNNTPKNAYLHGTLLMGGIWFLSRYFTESHLFFVITNLLITLFL